MLLHSLALLKSMMAFASEGIQKWALKYYERVHWEVAMDGGMVKMSLDWTKCFLCCTKWALMCAHCPSFLIALDL